MTPAAPPCAPPPSHSLQVNLAKGEGLEACLQGLTRGGALRLVAVINAAAISQPAACERDEAAAAAVNVPTHLLAALAWHRQQHGAEPLLIHMSTDQVAGCGVVWCGVVGWGWACVCSG